MFKTSNVHMVVNMIRFEGSDVIDIERMSALPNGAHRRQEGVGGISAAPKRGVYRCETRDGLFVCCRTQVSAWFQKLQPSSKLKRTPPIGAPKAAATPAAAPPETKSRITRSFLKMYSHLPLILRCINRGATFERSDASIHTHTCIYTHVSIAE